MFSLLFRLLFLTAVAFVAYEAFLGYGYYRDLSGAAQGLERASDRAAGGSLIADEARVHALRSELVDSSQRLKSTRGRMQNDPGLKLAARVPAAQTQISAFDDLVESTSLLADGGIKATDVLHRYFDLSADGLSPAEAVELRGGLAEVRAKLTEAKERRALIGDHVLPVLADATAELDRTIALVETLLNEYEGLLS